MPGQKNNKPKGSYYRFIEGIIEKKFVIIACDACITQKYNHMSTKAQGSWYSNILITPGDISLFPWNACIAQKI